MKKIMSRILIIFIIIITLFEFFCLSNVSYAALEITDEFVNSLTGLMGGMVAYGIWMQRLIILGVSTVFNGFLSTSFAACCGVNSGFSAGIATPYSIFFNKYVLFDVDFFNFNKTSENSTIIDIRSAVAEWFYIIRNISSAVLLCILIYVGIRMALSTVAEEKAKYKKMFLDWVCSLALIYILQYIIIFTVTTNNAIVNALKELYKGSDMDTALLQIALQAVMPVGISSIIATLVYCFIVLQTIAFMIAYTQRMLKTGFLILISPLISITYSIDKMGDGKAQALNNWLKEFVYTILIQPFHCLIYMAFVTTAVTLLGEGTIIAAILNILAGESLASQLQFNQITNGVLVILCLKFVNDGEKAVRKIFNFQDDGNLTSMAAGALVGVAVIKNAQKIGSSATNTMNSAKNAYSKFSQTFSNDLKNAPKLADGLKNSKIGQGISNAATKHPKIAKGISSTKSAVQKSGKWVGEKGKKINGKVNDINNKYKEWSERKHAQWGKDANDSSKNKYIRGAQSWLRKQVPTAQNLKNAMPNALGMMAAAMTYAAGDASAMEAIGVGTAIQKGSEDYFSSTLGTIADQAGRADKIFKEAKFDEEKQKRDAKILSSVKEKNPENLEKYNTEDKRQKVIEQFIRDQQDLKKENNGRSEEIDKNTKQLKEDGVYDAIKERAELEGEGAEKFKENAVRERYDTSAKHGIGSKYGEDAITKKGEEILKLIEEYKSKLQEDSTTDDSKMENKLGDNDASSPEKMFDTLKQKINQSVIGASGGSFNISEIMQNEMGLNDDGSDAYQKLVAAVLSYRMMMANDRAEGSCEQWEKLNGNREDIYKRNYGKL